MTDPRPTVLWFRRDLRLHDHPALLAAIEEAGPAGVLPLFVVDPALWDGRPTGRAAWLAQSLAALDESLDGRLVVRRGRPRVQVARVAAEIGASTVHVTADYAPYGMRRDEAVAKALADKGIGFERLGSPYAVAPGRVKNGAGKPYSVFTPFAKAWTQHGWRAPVDRPRSDQTWVEADSDPIPTAEPPDGLTLPPVGELAARRRWQTFLKQRLDDYTDRDFPAREVTSGLSPHLRWGEIHPRTLLGDLSARRGKAAQKFRSELAWREFYADVLFRAPRVTQESYRTEFEQMEWDEPDERVRAWKQGRTGFPLVDAGMRELLATGTMHNRVRMIAASFLVKDLHVDWRLGARHFMERLVDGDLASNQLNWQWVAGCGTDAAPFFRIFNPTTQAQKFDPDETYVRRWVPEVGTDDYPAPIVDHAEERAEALARLEKVKQ